MIVLSSLENYFILGRNGTVTGTVEYTPASAKSGKWKDGQMEKWAGGKVG